MHEAPGRVLGVDLGTRRVGLALTDPLRIVSSPLETVPMTGMRALVDRILRLCAERGVGLVVIGLPVSADGTAGPGCARARRLAEMLHAAGTATALQNESWSSRDAEAALRETGRTRRSSRERVDAVAASLILRDYLAEASPS